MFNKRFLGMPHEWHSTVMMVGCDWRLIWFSFWFAYLDRHWLMIGNLWCVTLLIIHWILAVDELYIDNANLYQFFCVVNFFFLCIRITWKLKTAGFGLIVFSPSAYRFWVRCLISDGQEDATTYSSFQGPSYDDEHLAVLCVCVFP